MNILVIPPNDILRHPIPNRIYHIFSRLSRRHNIYLLSFPRHPLASQVIIRSMKALEIAFRPVTTSNLGLYYLFNHVPIHCALKKVLEKEVVDVIVHANIFPSLEAIYLAKKFRIKNVYDFLDYFPESASAYYDERAKWFVETVVRICSIKALMSSDLVITPSYGLKKILENYTNMEKIHVIPNGVDPEIFKPIDQEYARKTINLDYTGYIALLYGSLDVWIDVAAVLKAVKLLRQQGIDIIIMLVGLSHKKEYYMRIVKEARKYGIDKYILIYPPQPYEKMPLFINACDIILSPIKKQLMNFATPLKIIEALACGKPVITLDIAEFKIWFKDCLLTYTNLNKLPDKLKEAISISNIGKAKLIEYAEVIRRIFDWNLLSRRYNAVIEKC
ncbi:MAG: glycosyltransferase [Nitrososphaeria archaeon]